MSARTECWTFAPNAAWLVACQTLARTFAAAEGVLAVVVIAEEFGAQHRGWGIGASRDGRAAARGYRELGSMAPYPEGIGVAGRALSRMAKLEKTTWKQRPTHRNLRRSVWSSTCGAT